MSALPLGADIDVGVRNFAGISIGPCWRGPQCTAAPTTQWVYCRVSRASLQKTGVFLDSAGDFWEFSTQKVRTSVSKDYWRREKPALGNFAIWGVWQPVYAQETAAPQLLVAQFPTPIKEDISRNREFFANIREFRVTDVQWV